MTFTVFDIRQSAGRPRDGRLVGKVAENQPFRQSGTQIFGFCTSGRRVGESAVPEAFGLQKSWFFVDPEAKVLLSDKRNWSFFRTSFRIDTLNIPAVQSFPQY